MTIRDHGDYIRVLLYSNYITITGWRGPPNLHPHLLGPLHRLARLRLHCLQVEWCVYGGLRDSALYKVIMGLRVIVALAIPGFKDCVLMKQEQGFGSRHCQSLLLLLLYLALRSRKRSTTEAIIEAHYRSYNTPEFTQAISNEVSKSNYGSLCRHYILGWGIESEPVSWTYAYKPLLKSGSH